MLPAAHISHRISNRLRIRIPAQKGNITYFAELEKKLSGFEGLDSLELNPRIGSALMIGKGIDVQVLEDFAKRSDLFEFESTGKGSIPLSRRLVEPLGNNEPIPTPV